MHRLRADCPWDAQQTHTSLVPYLVEEATEVVEAIEVGTPADLREELGDLLLQVVFHSELAAEEGAFDVEDVAAGIADKLVARHPHVFPYTPEGGDPLAPSEQRVDSVPTDLHATWEQRKAVEKNRASALDGIPEQLSALARGAKILSRARSRGVALEPPAEVEPITDEELGESLLALVRRAQASGLDAEQSARAAVRRLEQQVREAESR
ncbi:MazG family protein [Microlunatus flavus]|uniref:XTP/dITP diphosphohydrolase n=1 Tax=Microlunatus flavus TaxID=1036181 RepID=A0A1H9K4E0_9ACTN|nr:MazG family protein [Microlunatus flavus]SEQ94071.1 XTP/dITP diphosphohydrolase [Microlunatus flavus]